MAKNKKTKRRTSPANHKKNVAAVAATSSTSQSTPSMPTGLLWGLLFLVVTPPLLAPYGHFEGYSPHLHMASIIHIVGVGLITAFFFVFRNRVVEFARSPIVLPLTLLYVWALLSIFWAHAKYEALISFMDYSGAFLAAMLVLLLVKNIDWMRKIVVGLMIAGLLLAILGIVQYLFDFRLIFQHAPPAATFSNKNFAAHYMLLVFPLALVAVFNSKQWWHTWGAALAAAAILLMIIFTRSRAAWLSVLFELALASVYFLYMLLVRRHNIFSTIHQKIIVLLGILALALLLVVYAPKIVQLFELQTQTHQEQIQDEPALLSSAVSGATMSAQNRVVIWVNSIPMFIDHAFLGVGIGNWGVYYAKYQSWLVQDLLTVHNQQHQHAHNDYIELFCEFGLPGIVLFLWILFGFIRIVKPLLFSAKIKPTHSLLFASMVIALGGVAIDALFTFPFKKPMPLLIAGVYFASLSVAYCLFVKQRPLQFRMSKVFGTSMGSVLLIAGALLIFTHYHLLQAKYLMRVVNADIMKIGQEGRIVNLARQALEHNPLETKIKWYIGAALLRMGRPEQSIPLLEDVYEQYPYAFDVTRVISSSHFHLHQYDQAAKYYGKLIDVQESSPKLTGLYLKSLYNDKQYRKMLQETVRVLPRFTRLRDIMKRRILSSSTGGTREQIQTLDFHEGDINMFLYIGQQAEKELFQNQRSKS